MVPGLNYPCQGPGKTSYPRVIGSPGTRLPGLAGKSGTRTVIGPILVFHPAYLVYRNKTVRQYVLLIVLLVFNDWLGFRVPGYPIIWTRPVVWYLVSGIRLLISLQFSTRYIAQCIRKPFSTPTLLYLVHYSSAAVKHTWYLI